MAPPQQQPVMVMAPPQQPMMTVQQPQFAAQQAVMQQPQPQPQFATAAAAPPPQYQQQHYPFAPPVMSGPGRPGFEQVGQRVLQGVGALRRDVRDLQPSRTCRFLLDLVYPRAGPPRAGLPPLAPAILARLVARMTLDFTKDIEAVDFVQESVSLELCQQLRDHLVAGSDGGAARVRDLCLGSCSGFLVGVVNVLVAAPRLAGGARDAAYSAAPLCAAVAAHFGALARVQRGCAAVQRVMMAAAADTACADLFVDLATANAATMVFHQHSNYLLSNVLKYLAPTADAAPDAAPDAASDAAPDAVDGCEVSTESATTVNAVPTKAAAAAGGCGGGRSATAQSIRASANNALRLTCRGHTEALHNAVPVRFATVTPAAWLALVRAVAAALLPALADVLAEINASHVLEHCLTRVDHGVYGAELAPLLAGVMQPAVLNGVLRRPASLHLVKGLAALFATPRHAQHAAELRAAVAAALRDDCDDALTQQHVARVAAACSAADCRHSNPPKLHTDCAVL
jgi:hypothetical protein